MYYVFMDSISEVKCANLTINTDINYFIIENYVYYIDDQGYLNQI